MTGDFGAANNHPLWVTTYTVVTSKRGICVAIIKEPGIKQTQTVQSEASFTASCNKKIPAYGKYKSAIIHPVEM